MNQLKNSLKILVADDEQLAREKIVGLLYNDSDEIQITEASNGKEAIRVLLSEEIDLVFLDIKMTDMTGFEMLTLIPKERIPIIIFVTAFNDFAVKAFEVNAVDFLLKPFKKSRFVDSFSRAKNLLVLKKRQEFQEKMIQLMHYFEDKDPSWAEESKTFLERITLKINKRYQFVNVLDIKYILASGYYAEIFTLQDKKFVNRISMTALIEKLNPQHFIRVNRSTIVNRGEILEIVSEGFGDYSIKMKDRKSFNLSKSYKTDFLKQVGIK